MIKAHGLYKTYRSGAGTLPVLRGIDLAVPDGEFLAITGPSGAGKSTLLHLLAGLDVPSKGHILWNGENLTGMDDRQRARWRNETIGVVFQFYHLLPELTAVENVMLPGLVRGGTRRRPLRERAMARLKQVGLKDRAAHQPSQLSGGELQRVAIARALINEPKVIFCDEPTGNLDSKTGEAVTELLMGAHREQRTSLILVTHEHALAKLADRWLVLRDGQVVEETSSSARQP